MVTEQTINEKNFTVGSLWAAGAEGASHLAYYTHQYGPIEVTGEIDGNWLPIYLHGHGEETMPRENWNLLRPVTEQDFLGWPIYIQEHYAKKLGFKVGGSK